MAEAIVDPALPVIDSHIHLVDAQIHLWNAEGHDYLAPQYIADAKSGHNVQASVYVECATHYDRSAPPAFQPVGETRHAVQQAEVARGSGVAVAAAILGCANLATLGAGARPVLEAHIEAGQGRFRGIRERYAFHPDPAFAYAPHTRYVEDNVIPRETVLAGARCLRDLGLVLEMWGFHTQLDDMADLAGKVPDLPVTVNHCGGPLGIGPYADRRDQVFADWQASLRKLAARPNVNMKLSGFGMARLGFSYPAGGARSSDELAAAWRPYVRAIVDTFGPQRVIFGSNFPVDQPAGPYAMVLNGYKKALAEYSEAERSAILAGNARRFYRIEGAAA